MITTNLVHIKAYIAKKRYLGQLICLCLPSCNTQGSNPEHTSMLFRFILLKPTLTILLHFETIIKKEKWRPGLAQL